MKFGGKSLATPQKVQNICKNIKKIYKNDKKIIIIVSAMGLETDNLIKKSQEYYFNNLSKRELDVLLSTGETQSAALFSLALNSAGVPAKSFQAWQLGISTFGDFQNSKIAYINKQPLDECLNDEFVAVVAGFQGINKQNEITTLGRGGSDTTAAAIGATFNHDIEIYSDFDGIFAGDPRIQNYKKIKNIDYISMQNMAQAGAKVLDPRATKIAEEYNLKIFCKQSEFPNKTGTIVSNIEKSFISLSTISNLCKITINFSQDNDILFIIKNVLNNINNINFYNLIIKSDAIEFFVLNDKKDFILSNLAKKFKLIKN